MVVLVATIFLLWSLLVAVTNQQMGSFVPRSKKQLSNSVDLDGNDPTCDLIPESGFDGSAVCCNAVCCLMKWVWWASFMAITQSENSSTSLETLGCLSPFARHFESSVPSASNWQCSENLSESRSWCDEWLFSFIGDRAADEESWCWKTWHRDHCQRCKGSRQT